MNKYIGYIATTKDNFIATKEGKVDFLEKYQTSKEIGKNYEEFIKDIDVVVTGSTTYSQYLTKFNPYQDIRVIVLSSKITSDPKYKYDFFDGDVTELDKVIKDKTVWVMGGDKVIKQYVDAKLLKNIIVTKINESIDEGITLLEGYDFKVTKEEIVGPVINEHREYN